MVETTGTKRTYTLARRLSINISMARNHIELPCCDSRSLSSRSATIDGSSSVTVTLGYSRVRLRASWGFVTRCFSEAALRSPRSASTAGLRRRHHYRQPGVQGTAASGPNGGTATWRPVRKERAEAQQLVPASHGTHRRRVGPLGRALDCRSSYAQAPDRPPPRGLCPPPRKSTARA